MSDKVSKNICHEKFNKAEVKYCWHLYNLENFSLKFLCPKKKKNVKGLHTLQHFVLKDKKKVRK